MKKILTFLLILLMPTMVSASELAGGAVSSILMEVSTGKILYEYNSDDQLAPASMTKLMTMLLIMEALESEKITLNDDVLITNNAASMGGSQVFLEAGSQMKAEELLKSIAIASANDSSVAMAEHISGTEGAFLAQMNNRCKELGCQNTNFMNVHGLDANNHYSSARDMALIARELLKHEKILNYTNIYEEYLKKPDGSSTWMVNTNKLIKYYTGLDGLKTGFTDNAGYCLTATAKRNNMRFISIVMKEPTPTSRNNDIIELLNYGFSNYKLKIILDTTKELGELEVIKGKSKTVKIALVENATNLENINEEKKYTYNIIASPIKAPVKPGDIVGSLDIIESGKVISSFDITVKNKVLKANVWDLYKRNLNSILIG
ncbi:MAG: D-alanyl-D-alanine carboxypeptidase, partial [Bacilli bacterium]|nr:D-alanyl-D-alanine carboxypeptidase [Bacilli bacterium]